ncbi:hypothetical protein D3C87_289910 [compost metagenome]
MVAESPAAVGTPVPGACTTISQDVSTKPGSHDSSALFLVTPNTVRFFGSGHAGIGSIIILSINKEPVPPSNIQAI